MNEINLTLDEFDLMLNEYEIDFEQKGKKKFKNSIFNNKLIISNFFIKFRKHCSTSNSKSTQYQKSSTNKISI